jgi:hypothetical protein
MADPVHAIGQILFVPALRRMIEEIIGGNKDIEPAAISGIGVIHRAVIALRKYAQARRLGFRETGERLVVIGLARIHFGLFERDVKIPVEVGVE